MAKPSWLKRLPFPHAAANTHTSCGSWGGAGIGGHPLVLVAVGLAAHVLAPRHLARVEAEVDAADVVVLAELGPAQA